MVKAVVGNCRYGIAVGEDHACKRTTRSKRVVAHSSNAGRNDYARERGAGIERSFIYCRQGGSGFEGKSGERGAALEGNPTYESDRSWDCDRANVCTVHKNLLAYGGQRTAGFEGDGRQSCTSSECRRSNCFDGRADCDIRHGGFIGNYICRDVRAIERYGSERRASVKDLISDCGDATRNGYFRKAVAVIPEGPVVYRRNG